MTQSLSDRPQALDDLVQFVRLGIEAPSIHFRQAVGRQHRGNLVQCESTGASERDQGEPVQDGRVEQAALAATADRGDEALLLVVAKCEAGTPVRRDTSAMSTSFMLDLKSA